MRPDSNLLHQLRPAHIEKVDADHVRCYNELVVRIAASKPDRDAFVHSFILRHDLGPIMYDGDPATARVAFLFLNPNYADDATRESHYRPDPDHPMAALSPKAAPGTRTYYSKVFKHLLQTSSREHLAKQCLKVELCPWASHNFPSDSRLVQALASFPSRTLTLKLVEHLAESGAVIAIMKGVGTVNPGVWIESVPALAALVGSQVFKHTTPRNNYLTPALITPAGWAAIQSALSTSGLEEAR